MIEKEITKKVKYKDLISLIQRANVINFYDLTYQQRDSIITKLALSNSLINSKGHLKPEDNKIGKINKQMTQWIITSLFLIAITLFLVFLIFITNALKLSFDIDFLIKALTTFGLVSVVCVFLIINWICCYMFYHNKNIKDISNLGMNTGVLLLLEEEEKTTPRYLSIIDLSFEVFKTDNEKKNEYIRSIIIQEFVKLKYKEMKETSGKDISNVRDLLMDRLSNQQGIDILILEIILKQEKKSYMGIFLDTLLKNIDNKLTNSYD